MMKLISRFSLIGIIIIIFKIHHLFSNKHVKPIEYVVFPLWRNIKSKICEEKQAVIQVPIILNTTHSMETIIGSAKLMNKMRAEI